MNRLTTKITSFLALLITGTAISGFPLTAYRAAAESASAQLSRSAAAAGQQRLLSQMLASDVVMLHLGIEREAAANRIRGNLTRFAQILNGLLYGDPNLGLVATGVASIKAPLHKVNEAWPLFSAAIKNVVGTKRVSAEQLTSIAGLSEVLFDATGETRAAFDKAVPRRFHSQLMIATVAAERQIALTQKMIKEYLLIAADQGLRKNRVLLAASYKMFDKALKGLINGDTDLGLISVADPRIQAQLAKVERVWSACLPLLLPAAKDAAPDRKTVIQTLNLNRQLMREATAAAVLYRAL